MWHTTIETPTIVFIYLSIFYTRSLSNSSHKIIITEKDHEKKEAVQRQKLKHAGDN